MNRILGIDPGTACTGFGVIQGRNPSKLVECGVIRTKASDDLNKRLHDIYEGVSELIQHHQPEAVAVETVFYGKNVRSTVTLAHTRAVVLLAAAQSDIQLFEYSPASVKRAVAGNGRAGKEQVAYMVQKILRLAEPPRPSDAADGIALALTCLMDGRLR